MSNLISKIKTKAAEFAATRNQELVDVEMLSNSAVKTLKIIVGSQEGPKVADLTAINKAFREYCTTSTDLKILDDYAVEVCSPGLERPLTTTADFKRNLTRFIKVQFVQDTKTVKLEFRLDTVSDDELTGILDDGKAFSIKRSDLQKAQPAVRFK